MTGLTANVPHHESGAQPKTIGNVCGNETRINPRIANVIFVLRNVDARVSSLMIRIYH